MAPQLLAGRVTDRAVGDGREALTDRTFPSLIGVVFSVRRARNAMKEPGCAAVAIRGQDFGSLLVPGHAQGPKNIQHHEYTGSHG